MAMLMRGSGARNNRCIENNNGHEYLGLTKKAAHKAPLWISPADGRSFQRVQTLNVICHAPANGPEIAIELVF